MIWNPWGKKIESDDKSSISAAAGDAAAATCNGDALKENGLPKDNESIDETMAETKKAQ